MSDDLRDPETLDLFVSESLEALSRMESLLLAAERGDIDSASVASLFRDIHTIKGTSSFLSLPRIGALSHVAEDLLAAHREGTIPMTPEHASLLLRVADALRSMVEITQECGDEGDYEVEPLIAELRRKLTQRSVQAMQAVPPIAAAPRAPLPRLGKILLERNLITEEQLEAALVVQEHTQPRPLFGEVLLRQAVITHEQLEEALSLQGGPREGRTPEADAAVRVPVQVLDHLMNLIGELVLARNEIAQFHTHSGLIDPQRESAAARLSAVTSELQAQVMKTRMQPVARVFERMPRMVRDLAQRTGKEVDCRIVGTTAEIDRALIELLRDPLMHIVRNCIDHGIESKEERAALGKPERGTVTLTANQEGGWVIVEVHDDGRGLDPVKLRNHAVEKGIILRDEAQRLSESDALSLIFRAGFSTAASVSDISGRGVGMDVVATYLERAGGKVELQSQVGKGTLVRLVVPFTLAILPALLVRSGGQRFAIPQAKVLELVCLDPNEPARGIEWSLGAPMHRLRGELLPLAWLGDVLGISEIRNDLRSPKFVAVLSYEGTRYGLVLDEVEGTEEIVVKPLGGAVARLRCYAGATILGDGGIALILETSALASLAGIERAARVTVGQAEARSDRRVSHLVFTLSDGTQFALATSQVSRIEIVSPSRIERAGSVEVLQQNGSALPILRLESKIGVVPVVSSEAQTVLVIDAGARIALPVTSLLDTVELSREDITAHAVLPGTSGSALIFGRTTWIVDVSELAPSSAKRSAVHGFEGVLR